jgi:hypothetical protein
LALKWSGHSIIAEIEPLLYLIEIIEEVARSEIENHSDREALWKDADPEIPILKQAKAEYAKPQ